MALMFTACSSGEKKAGEPGENPEVAADMGGDDSKDLFAEEEAGKTDDEDLFASEAKNNTSPNNTSPEVQETAGSNIKITDDTGEYTVEKGDTLMLIAFKLYGDYSMWKKVLDMNPGLNPKNIKSGSVLKYNAPAEKFVWNPQGNPYLIKQGDTLGTISNEKYGTVSKWKVIFENNRPMIRNPNLIFAGFTLYYVPDDRSVASGGDI